MTSAGKTHINQQSGGAGLVVLFTSSFKEEVEKFLRHKPLPSWIQRPCGATLNEYLLFGARPYMHMDLDAMLQDLGQFGKFQVYYFTLLLFPTLLTGFRVTEYVFTTMNIPHRCRVPECENGASPTFSPPWLPVALPEGLDHTPPPCLRYKPRYPPNDTHFNNSCTANLFTNVSETCDSWVFSDPLYTIAKTYDIMCPEDLWKLTFLSSISVFTGFLGEPLSGIVSDRIGRKKVLVYGSIFICVMGLIRSVCSSYIMLIIFEGIDGLICGALFTPAFLLGLETLPPSKRLLGSMLINVYWPFGEITLGVVMWLAQDWRLMQRVFYTPMLVISILLIWLLPESARWLHTKGKREDVKQLFNKIARFNKTEAFLPRIFDGLHQLNESPESKKQDEEASRTLRLGAAVRSPVILLRTVVCALCWVANMYMFYGISQSSVYFPGDQFVSFILVSAVEIPGYVASLWVPDWRWLGRRGGMVSCFVLGGITSLAMLFVTPDETTLTLVLSLFSKFFATLAFTVLCLYTAEVFPTEVRHSLFALCSVSGRIGAIAAQQTPLLGVAPMLLVGLVSMVGGALSLTCPETLGTPLPDTLEEAENIGRSTKNKQPSSSSVHPAS